MNVEFSSVPRGASANRSRETRIGRPSAYFDTSRVLCIDRSAAVIPTEIYVKCRCLTEAFLVTNSSSKLHFSSDRSSNKVSENKTEMKLSIQQAQLYRNKQAPLPIRWECATKQFNDWTGTQKQLFKTHSETTYQTMCVPRLRFRSFKFIRKLPVSISRIWSINM